MLSRNEDVSRHYSVMFPSAEGGAGEVGAGGAREADVASESLEAGRVGAAS